MTIGYVGPNGQWVTMADQPSGGLFGQMAALVSGDANSATGTSLQILQALPYTTTWALRATALAAGHTTCFFTDVGVGGGSVWTYSGGRWRPYTGRVRIKNLTTSVSNNTSTKTVLDYAILLAGLVQDGDEIMVRWLKERTGGTSDTDATDLGIGTVAGTFGTSSGLTSSGLATTNITLSSIWGLRRESATSVRRTNVVAANGVGAATSNNTAVTVPDMDAQTTYLQMTSQLTTAAGEVAWLRFFAVDLIVGA